MPTSDSSEWLKKVLRRIPDGAIGSSEDDLEQALGFLGKNLGRQLQEDKLRLAVVLEHLEFLLPTKNLQPYETEEAAKALRWISRQRRGDEIIGPFEGKLVEKGGGWLKRNALVGVPLGKLAGARGHLFVLGFASSPDRVIKFSYPASLVFEAVLAQELVRSRAIDQLGRLRHSILGPVQGLASAALEAVHVAKESKGSREIIEGLETRIMAESESIRLWRENSRVAAVGSVAVRKSNQQLKPLFFRCAERYRAALSERNIHLDLHWIPRGGIQFRFDPGAIDVMLSNLLDNARKYAFANTTVEFGTIVDGEYAIVWVQDDGHPIPESKGDRIYRKGARAEIYDPFRHIEGTGLGLHIAVTIVEGHGGTISHSSVHLAGSGPTARYRVRFTVKIPLDWRGQL